MNPTFFMVRRISGSTGGARLPDTEQATALRLLRRFGEGLAGCSGTHWRGKRAPPPPPFPPRVTFCRTKHRHYPRTQQQRRAQAWAEGKPELPPWRDGAGTPPASPRQEDGALTVPSAAPQQRSSSTGSPSFPARGRRKGSTRRGTGERQGRLLSRCRGQGHQPHRETPGNYRGAGAALAAGQSESRVSLVSGTGMSESGTRSWFQSRCGSVSTMQGRAKSVSRE